MSTIQQHVINLANQLQKAEIQSHRHQQKVLELQQALKNANQQFSLTNKRLLSAERKVVPDNVFSITQSGILPQSHPVYLDVCMPGLLNFYQSDS